MRISRTLWIAALAAILALALANQMVFATPPSGQHPTAPALGSIADAVQVNIDRIKLQTKDRVDVAMFEVTYDPGGFSGWHTHPGVLIVLVKSGSVVRTVGCGSTTYHAGDVFIESDEQPSGQVANASTTASAVLEVTQLVPSGSGRRVEADAPAC